ncbi:Phosphoribosylaminoimidazole carboxylase [Trichuris trichiura]|uniref:Phosphoribosylaminoimidazole carboxylase n=1 Tax=Trichuris trichiura TaxID=36087 RepID=A0A077Z770_TRITR|nr:Phosphoribosylaminoimidazole carboxylase [Trichuris trichiura]
MFQYPDPSFPTPSQPTEAEIIEIKKITTSIKRLIKSQRITVNGQPASFDKLVTHKRTESGIEVVFVVTDPRAGNTDRTPSVWDPSVSTFTKKLICKGILSLVPGVKDTIKCEEVKDGDGQYPDPSFPTPSQPTEVETVEITKITTSIKRLIKSQRITVNGQPASFDKLVTHKRTESGIEVVFVVKDPRADNTDGASTVLDPSISTFSKKLICKGILSLVPGVKDTIKCEALKGGEKQVGGYSTQRLLGVRLDHKPNHGLPTEAEITEIRKVTTSIQRVIVIQGITVNGQPAHFDKLVTHKKTESGFEVVFIVRDPRADNTGGTSSSVDPSGSLTVLGITKKLICKGTLSIVPGVRDNIKCEEIKDSVEERPKPNLPGGGHLALEDITEIVKITTSIKRLLVTKGIRVNGQLAHFETLITHKKTESGIEILFTVTDPRSDAPGDPSSGVDPSGTFTTVTQTTRLICEGILSLVLGVNNDIKCEDPKDNFEKYPIPSFATPIYSLREAVEQIIRITASIKRLIVSEGITVNGQLARFETLITHKKTQSGIEIVFTVIDPRADSTSRIFSGMDPTKTSATLLYSKKLICKGILSLVRGVKNHVKCEEIKDSDEQIDPSLPSSPSAPWANDPATTVVDTVEYVKILSKVKRLVFVEKMTVGGYYVRVDKLTKLEKVVTGMNIAFTIIPTTCATKVTPLGPQPSDPSDPEVVETTEIAEITTQIKTTIITKRFIINGQHARLDKLISHKKVDNGVQVEFTIMETTCDGNVHVTMEQLYGLSCIRHGYSKKLICKGIITTVPGMHPNIECSERDDVDEFDPSLPSTSHSDVIIDATTVSSQKVTISVQKLMLSESMTIKGHHVRVEKLTKVQKVISGVLVEFTISETTCSGRLRLTLEVIYSERCSVVQSTTVIVCKGLLPVRQGISHTIRCSGGDKLTEEYPGGPLYPSDSDGQMDKDSIYLLLKKTLFNKAIHLNGWYARLVSLDKIQRSIRNELLVSFTIAPSKCRSERKAVATRGRKLTEDAVKIIEKPTAAAVTVADTMEYLYA